MKTVAVIVVLAFGLGSSVVDTGQAGATPPPMTYDAQVVVVWKALHDKIFVMAKDTVFPEAKLGWKPHPDSRSMLEEYRHVTIGLEMSLAQLAGEPFDYTARMKADEAKPKTLGSVASDMEAAIARSYPVVQKTPHPRLVFWIDHQAEHYGKLVSNYRMNGIVPPISRPRGEPPQARPAIPDTFTNLHVLPKTIARADLLAIMKGFSTSMNVRCSHCHVATDDLSQADFGADDKPAKLVTRQLLKDIAKVLGK